jgi:hypothetical protein
MPNAARIFVFLCLCSRAHAAEPLAAAVALDSLGVVTHLDVQRTPYLDVPRVTAALRYLGIRRLRDMTPRRLPEPYQQLAAQGFRFDFVVRSEAVNELPATIASLEEFERRFPGSIVSLEGLNEIRLWPPNYHGVTGFAGGVAVQCDLYKLAKGSAALRTLPVLALTLGGASAADQQRLGDISQCADLGNAHIYFGDRPPWSSWDFAIDLARRSTPGLTRSAVTETGYSAAIATPHGIPEDIQTRYLLVLILEAWRQRIPATYLYQLVDDRLDEHDWSRSLGVYRNDWTPRPAAHALHALTGELASGSHEPRELATEPVIDNPAGELRTLTLARADGSCVLALWRRVALWDQNARRRNTIAPLTVQVRTPAPRAWLIDPSADERHALARQGDGFAIELADAPLLLEIAPHSTNPRSREK